MISQGVQLLLFLIFFMKKMAAAMAIMAYKTDFIIILILLPRGRKNMSGKDNN
ncbi:MAG: hypothetical protein KJ717_04515 [Proteobacteria bacterium]|nr:hypothetical protein [Pseudomonadota bacterium]